MKIAILYDSFMERGGAEITLPLLAEHLDADIITAGLNPLVFHPSETERVIDINNFTIRQKNPLGLLESGLRHFVKSKKFEYDLFIFSGFYAIFGAFRAAPGVYYSLSPNRSLYDLYDFRYAHYPRFGRPPFIAITKVLRFFDQKAIRRMKRVVAQSKTVQKRLKCIYGRKSTVIYPPVQTHAFYFEDFGDFYLTVSRLSPPKRIPLIIEAFKRMPTKKLVIAGDGEDRTKIIKKVQGIPNIQYIGPVNDKEKQKLYAKCLATIFMGKNEDFGLTPLEGNAAGKMCIAANEGGCRETVLPWKSGFLIEATPKAIIETVQNFDASYAEDMKTHCIEWARQFDTKICVKRWKAFIAEVF